MIVLGLTGSLGTGKTTVAEMFARLGARVLDADTIANALLVKKGPCRSRIQKKFPTAAGSGGEIDRMRLAQDVFQSAKKLRDLEKIIHPAVEREIRRALRVFKAKRSVHMVVLDVPLLFEAGLDALADAVIVVRANQRQQIERVTKSRSITRQEALSRLRRQMPQKDKMERADFIIDNRFSQAKTRAQVKRIWDGLVSV